jgi:hypothetical protein
LIKKGSFSEKTIKMNKKINMTCFQPIPPTPPRPIVATRNPPPMERRFTQRIYQQNQLTSVVRRLNFGIDHNTNQNLPNM